MRLIDYPSGMAIAIKRADHSIALSDAYRLATLLREQGYAILSEQESSRT